MVVASSLAPMPDADAILSGLGRIANEAFVAAVLWHSFAAALFSAIGSGWRPSSRLAAMALALPLVSVSAFAWAYANPFNGASFALLAAAVAALGSRAPRLQVRPGPWWAVGLGGLLVVFAWVYPHFLVGRSPLAYLVGSPMGLIPCPTLALVMGLALVAGGPGGRSTSLLLALAGLFYAVFGVARLGVVLDVALLAGPVGLLALGARATRPA